MSTTAKLVSECPDEMNQRGINEKSLALSPIAKVVSAASLHCAMTLLVDPIKAEDLVQREQVM